ncbi:MAG: hypothetical protein DBX59_11280 [Bacillota bacterium]|nr:MAG: hypothetical protein DBX59_11280 [Bacillota bacterium]
MKIGIAKKMISMILAVAAIVAFGVFSVRVFADEGDNITTEYFTVYENGSTGGKDEAVLTDGALKLALGEKGSAEFKRNLVLNALEVKFQLAAEMSKAEFKLLYDSYDVNGNAFIEEEKTVYKKEIENVVSIDGTSVTVGGETKTVAVSDKTYTVAVAVANPENGAYSFKITVNGTEFDLTEKTQYKPEMFGGNAVGKFAFAAENGGTVTVDSIAQGANKQDFVLTDGKITPVKSVVLLSEKFYNGETDAAIEKLPFISHSVVPAEYAIDAPHTASSFKIAVADEYKSSIAYDNESSTKTLRIKENGAEVKFQIVIEGEEENEVFGEFTVKSASDTVAPSAAATQSAIAAYRKALYEATRDGDHYIRLGSGNYLELPSMKSLFNDGFTAYDDLDYTVWYRTRTSDWTSTSSFKIPVNNAGKYEFYVLFEDESGNKMEKDDIVNDKNEFIEGIKVYAAAQDAEAGDGEVVAGQNFAFSFEVYDDAPISVTEAKGGQEKAYIGISYTAADFDVKAKSPIKEYQLFYSATEDGEYEEIIPSSELDEEEDKETYDKYAKYAYDGSLTFTPAETGYYKIILTVYGEGSMKSASAETVINALSTPKRVVPNENNWFLNNVWSLVFLSIGTLALIGIIVILCIKPKDAETAPAKKDKKSKK